MTQQETAELDEMQEATLEGLLAKREPTDSGFPEKWVPVEGVGKVLVRGLSRLEVLWINKVAKNPEEVEQITLARAMLKPKMTEEKVKAWQGVAVGGEIDPITAEVGKLSGMLKGASKAAYMAFEADPGSEFRPLPSGEAGHDGGDDAHGADAAPQQ